MAYEKQTWIDYPDETTPISAERLNHIEQGIEDADGSYLEYKDDNFRIYDRIIATQSLGTSNNADVKREVVGGSTFTQLKSYMDCKYDSTDENTAYMLPNDSYESLHVYYLAEGSENEYSCSEGTTRPYLVDETTPIPTKYSNAIPKKLKIYRSNGYYTYDITEADEYNYIKDGNGNIVKTYWAEVSNMSYYIMAFYGGYFHIALIDLLYRYQTYNQAVRTELSTSNYVYFPISVQFEIPESEDEIIFSATGRYPAPTDMSVYYDDGGTNTAYTYIYNAFPWSVYSVSGDYADKHITSITFAGASLTEANMYQDAEVANSNGLNMYKYYITALDTNYMLLCILVPVQGGLECWITRLVLDTHQFSCKDITVSETLTLHYEEPSIIDDTTASLTTTYSSSKIESLIADLQAQINALS